MKKYLLLIIIYIIDKVVNLMLIALSIANIGYSIYENENGDVPVFIVDYVTPSIMSVTFVSKDGTSHFKHKRMESLRELFTLTDVDSMSDDRSQESRNSIIRIFIYLLGFPSCMRSVYVQNSN